MEEQVSASAQVASNREEDIWSVYRRTLPRSQERKNIQEELVRKYQYLVRFIVRRMNVTPPRELDYEDLISYGKMGLLDSIERFDPSLGYAFPTYAASRIRGTILDELRRFDWISRSGREKIQTLDKAIEAEVQETGIMDHERVRNRLGLSRDQYQELTEIANRSYISCLDESVALEDTEVDKIDILTDQSPGPEDLVIQKEEIEKLHLALNRLTERERRLVQLYYFNFQNFRQIAQEFDLSESRISQLHKRVLSKLKDVLASIEVEVVP
ncbi:MAG: FliA/WhiG family RNA polymerase sigma factor [Thermovirga sp.]